MGAAHTPGPWTLCRHLESIENDRGCRCGYRGVVFGPDERIPMAICQPGHDPEPVGQEGLGPHRYPREIELANARLISAAPDLLIAAAPLTAANHDIPDDMPDSEWIEVRVSVGEIRAARAAIAKATTP